ncbi:hypothetical protein NW765_016081 [Fusarium oxysporum]|nr:hypothetical protein NW765_016081 [Fusarium oxysporum]
MGGYMHSMQMPLYFASKAALLTMVKSLTGLKRALGVCNAAICPGPAHVFQEPQYGDGNIVEIMMIGSKEEQSVHVHEVGLEALYHTVGALDVGYGGRIEVL